MIYRSLHDRNWYTDEKGGRQVQGAHPNDALQLKIMECTPFKECKGSGIYEGDLISDWVETDEEMQQTKYEVFFDEKEGQWMLDCSLKQDRLRTYALCQELKDFQYEIVGNIHEKI